MQKNKNLEAVIHNIGDTFDQIIVTQTNIRNFLPAKELHALFNNPKASIIIDPQEAISYSYTRSKNDCIIIAGSHYLGPTISKEFKISFENI